MLDRNLISVAATVAILLTAAACDSAAAVQRPPEPSSEHESDRAGVQPLAGVVEIARAERSADGGVTYYLTNVSGKNQEDLAYHVMFLYPATGDGAIAIADDVELSPQKDVVLLKTDTALAVRVDNPRPGKVVKATKLAIQDLPPVGVVAREGGQPHTGTVLLNGTLECVAMASDEETRAGKLWIEVENISGQMHSAISAKAVFVDAMTKEKRAESKWTKARDLASGARMRLDFDIAGLGKVANLTFLAKVKTEGL